MIDFGKTKPHSSRRAFFKHGALVLASTSITPNLLFAEKKSNLLRLGLVTDLHYADKPAAGSRHYRETLKKLEESALEFDSKKPSFLVELGDFIDAADSVDVEMRYLRTINREFSKMCKNRHYVLGNHCVDTLRKEEFLGEIGQDKSFYSFDKNGFHFVVLDSCFRSDGKPYARKNFKWTDANIPPEELEWLKGDLNATENKVVVFAHQRLDVNGNHGVRNNGEVRKILESSGKVQAVFQGHSHQNDLKLIGGIHYCTLVAMVEGAGLQNNGYSLMEIDSNGTISLQGFRKQSSYNLR